MAAVASIRVTGLGETIRALENLSDDLDDQLKALFLEGAELVKRDVRVPNRTGRLAGTLKAQATRKGATVKAGGARAPYGAPIHFGWAARNIRPQPFLYDPLDRRKADVIRLYEDGLQRILDTGMGA